MDKMAAYEESLKIYRDLKNVVDTAYDEGKVEGIAEGIQQKALEDAKKCKDAGVDIETIARCITIIISSKVFLWQNGNVGCARISTMKTKNPLPGRPSRMTGYALYVVRQNPHVSC